MSASDCETQVQVLRTIVEQHHEQMAELRNDLKCIKASVHDMNTKLASVVWCPKPGACIPILSAIEEHGARLRSLEDTRLEFRTSGKIIAGLMVGSGLLSALIGALVAKVW